MDKEKPWIVQLYTNPKFWAYLFAFFYLIILIYLRFDNPYKKPFFEHLLGAIAISLFFLPGFTVVTIWLKIKNNLNYSKIKTIGTILLILLISQLVGCVALINGLIY